jgi:MFS family permease
MNPPAPPSNSSSLIGNRYSVGTLTYTKMGIVALFGWLLWGDFCFQVMEAVTPSIIPLKLRHLDAPNWVIALIITTLPGVLNMTVCPWVSFKSDRHRGPRGRRLPFILWTLPFLTLFLVLLGFSEQIGHLIHSLLPASWNFSPSSIAVMCIGIFMVGFKFFDMFVNSVFWYLFNDVVPHEFLGRFLGLFRVVGGLVAMLFNFFIFKHAETHMTEILVGAAAIYALGMGMMCFKVKEGQYPPPPDNLDGKRGFFSEIKTYFIECYSKPYYWNLYLCSAAWAIAYTLGAFYVFLQKSIGLDLAQIGMISGAVSGMNMLLTYPAGALGDRYHPLRVLLWVKLVNIFVMPLGLIWLFFDFAPSTAFLISIVISAISLPFNVLTEAMMVPMYMRVLPLDRYGQFCSAMSILRSLATILGGLAAGLYLDLMKYLFHGSDYAYRFIPAWIIFWSAIALFFLWRLYRGWKASPQVDKFNIAAC